MYEQSKILKNCIRCKHCGDIIESKHVHDYVSCKCGAVAVDGGHEYLRRSFKKNPEEDFEELSEVVTERGRKKVRLKN